MGGEQQVRRDLTLAVAQRNKRVATGASSGQWGDPVLLRLKAHGDVRVRVELQLGFVPFSASSKRHLIGQTVFFLPFPDSARPAKRKKIFAKRLFFLENSRLLK